jgi:hypothetical protein
MRWLALLALLLIALITTGCSTRQWQSRLWTLPNEPESERQELGQLERSGLTFGLICTEFREIGNPSNAVIGIGASCRNDAGDTYEVVSNPIQVIDASNSIMKPLSLDHVMYKFYGGALRDAAQLERLNLLSETALPYGDSLAENILAAVVDVYRASESNAIITEFHLKEALPYDLYYTSFTPTSLPPGVSLEWIGYYPSTTDTLTVMLIGENLENGVTFGRPPPVPILKEPADTNTEVAFALMAIFGLFLVGVAAD